MSAQAERLLQEIRDLDAHISRMLVQARDLQRQMNEARDRRAEQGVVV